MELTIEYAELHKEIAKQERQSFIDAMRYLVSIGATIKVTKIKNLVHIEELITKDSFNTWFKID